MNTKKPSHFCKGFSLVAPLIGESCKFDAMISIINGAKT